MIQPLTLSKFWYHRMCEGVIFVASLVLIGYVYNFLTSNLDSSLTINDSAALLAGLCLAVAGAAYLWVPQRYTALASLAVYSTTLGLIGYLIYSGTGIASPYIGLWVICGVFAALFGIGGVLLFGAASSLYLLLGITSGALTQSALATTILAGYVPAITGFIVFHRRKSTTRAESPDTELSEVANKSEVVVSAITDGVLALDNEANIQLINPAAQQITGWGKKDAYNLSYRSVLKLTDAKDTAVSDVNDPVTKAIHTNEVVQTDLLNLVTQSGKKILINITVSPVGGPGAGVIVVFRDITKDKREEREQAEFISTASHEMRTPVASIEGYLGLALNPNTAQIDEKARSFIQKAHESAQHLGRLFQDLLDVSKAEDGRLSNNPKVLDINAFIIDVAQGLEPQATAKHLRYTIKLDPSQDVDNSKSIRPVYYAKVDPDHLREVTANLIENAIKYTPKGEVVIDIQGDSQRVRIQVADSGIGIAPEDIPHLFQKFYRIDNSDTREIGGTGLGLYLCRRLVEVMGGRIDVESTPGKGSTFALELPRLNHEEAMHMLDEEAKTPVNTPQKIDTPLSATPTPAVPIAPAPIPTTTPPVPRAVTDTTPQKVLRGAVAIPIRGENQQNG